MLTCSQCSSQVPDGYRFCWNCGAPIVAEEPKVEIVTPAEPAPSIQAQLVLVKGEGFPGISYHLRTKNHRMGRLHGTILFPDDRYLSLLHANLYYEDDKLFLADEGSDNGVFIKIHDSVEIEDGAHFLSGEQLLRFEQVDGYRPYHGVVAQPGDDAKFYGCPPEKSLHFRLVHLFRNHQEGAVFYASTNSVRLGREHCDLSFPFDRHISGRHARVYEENGQFFLQDLGSRNGTFLRINKPHHLSHGDHFFAGQQLFRVEISEAAA